MSDPIQNEKVAYVSPAKTTWSVALRDGTGLSGGLFTVTKRRYYPTVEEAKDAAERWVNEETVDTMELNVVARRLLDE